MWFPKTLLFVLFIIQNSQAQEEPWRFVTIADWHGAEGFVTDPIHDVPFHVLVGGGAQKKIETFQHIHDVYGGELVVLPGDSNQGKWYEDKYLKLLEVNSPQEAVLKAGHNCYQGTKAVLEQAGYSKILMAVGDHELGDNPWPAHDLKTDLLPEFRKAFAQGFNRDAEGHFLYTEPIGKANSRPLGTPFENTSYAYRHKNVLFVTVDVYKTMSFDFFDKRRGIGGEGAVRGTVGGAHLKWFKRVLSQARKDPTIKHIVVQAHLPILLPVRKVVSSGMFMERGEKSAFFQAMRDYNVDVYLAGEVHHNTATRDVKSNLVQVVSRGNGANNFLTVDVTDDKIRITSYKEMGSKPQYNNQYEVYGKILIDKSGENTKIKSGGSLKLLKRLDPMLHFSFDELVSLSDRPVLGLDHDDKEDTLVQRKVTIRGVECWNSFPNTGAFSQPYDAQVGHVALEEGVKGNAARFNATSRVAVSGLGPHSGGLKVSYALWFKTPHTKRNQILVHFGQIFGRRDDFNLIFTLTLDKGSPSLYAARDLKLEPATRLKLANDKWQHVAISMPKKSCKLSEVEMYVNGQLIPTTIKGTDDYLFFVNSGRVSIAGFGRSNEKMEKKFQAVEPYEGLMDEVFVWTRHLTATNVADLYKSFDVHDNYKCSGVPTKRYNKLTREECHAKCRDSVSCLGYDVKEHGAPQCRHFSEKPLLGKQSQGVVCGISSNRM